MNSETDSSSFLQIFQNIVSRHRHKNAIITEGRLFVTYGQLFSKASRISLLLKNQGIQPGEPIGICIGKSSEYIASMLGAWIAGAAFVPIDPQLPRERKQFIINQAQIKIVLALEGFEKNLTGFGVQTLNIDGNWQDEGEFEKLERSVFETYSEQLAYIIFTSGSTGRPKGVMVSHSGIWNFLKAQIAAFRFTENSNSLFVLSTNFDASISDIGCALLAGSTLFIEPSGLIGPGPHFLNLLKERQITHMDVPPSLLKAIPSEEAPDCLETIIIGGEACAPAVVREWAKRCLVVNVYGPTEATVCTSLGPCDAHTWERPLIGQPIANVKYFILDENQKSVNRGTPGELYIAGISLALGYVGEPELTARKFVEIDGKRLYRTGDLIVECEDGEFQFIGRVDRQFKLRGMLIEPEEIETKLAGHHMVARAAVLKRPLRAGSPGEKLVAFIQPKAGHTVKTNDFKSDLKSDLNHDLKSDLKNHLAKFLPLWMIPQIFEISEELPLTATGKIDLTALRELPIEAGSDAIATEPETAAQKTLVEVWKQIFGVETVGIHEDFFDLGGDSLNVIETVLAAHLRGLTIGPDLLMAHPTISELSKAIENAAGELDDKRLGVGSKTGFDNKTEFGNETGLGKKNGLGNKTGVGSFPVGNALDSNYLRKDVEASEKLLQLASETKNKSSKSKNERLKNIFLTGTTGFLGGRLLAELLQQTNATLFCLVRASSDEAGLSRIEHSIGLHGISISHEERKRIIPVTGDLTAVNLGMSSEKWSDLTASVDTVFHSGATVNMVKDYFELRPANVFGTNEIARFYLEGARKHLHYASTLSVFVATNHNTGVAEESDSLSRETIVFGGYAQTKFAAELLLRQLGIDAGPVSYYRFGLLTGDSQTGKSAKDDFLNMFARGVASLGCSPESNDDMAVDITPVDFAAAAMAHIAISDTVSGTSGTYHIANKFSLSLPVFLAVLKSVGVQLDVLPPQEFLSRLQNMSHKFNSEESAACLALCRALGSNESFSQFRTMDLFQATAITFDCSNTEKALEGTGIVCPKPTADLIALYMNTALKPMNNG